MLIVPSFTMFSIRILFDIRFRLNSEFREPGFNSFSSDFQSMLVLLAERFLFSRLTFQQKCLSTRFLVNADSSSHSLWCW